jgi:hypothetical protein
LTNSLTSFSGKSSTEDIKKAAMGIMGGMANIQGVIYIFIKNIYNLKIYY